MTFDRYAVRALIVLLLLIGARTRSDAQLVGVSATVGGGGGSVHWACTEIGCDEIFPQGWGAVPFVQATVNFRHLVGVSGEYVSWNKDEEHVVSYSLALSVEVPAGPVRVRLRGGMDHTTLDYPPAQILSRGQTNSTWDGTGPMAGVSVDVPVGRHIAVTPTVSYRHPTLEAPDILPTAQFVGTLWLIGVGFTVHN